MAGFGAQWISSGCMRTFGNSVLWHALCTLLYDIVILLQMLVRAHVAANTNIQILPRGPLSDEELQEGLMAGFGARARRKHVQRHAQKSNAQQSTQQVARMDCKDQESMQESESSQDEKQVPSSIGTDAPEAADIQNGSEHHSVQQATRIRRRDVKRQEDSESEEDEKQMEGGAAGDTIGHAAAKKAPGAPPSQAESTWPPDSSMQQEASKADHSQTIEGHHGSSTAAEDAHKSSGGTSAGSEKAQTSAPNASVTDLARGGHFWHGERCCNLPMRQTRQPIAVHHTRHPCIEIGCTAVRPITACLR